VKTVFKHSSFPAEVKMKNLIFGLLVLAPLTTYGAAEVYRIESGHDYNRYSDRELRKRVWELERAVTQLQARVFQLEGTPQTAPVDSWACTVKAMGQSYVGTGPNKAVASAKAQENCKTGQSGNSFHCSTPDCTQ